MHIVFGLDDNYVMPTGVAMTSVCVNNETEDIMFHLISTGLKEHNKRSLQKIADKYSKKIRYYEVDDNMLSSCPMGLPGQCSYVSIATYLKLFIVNVLPSDIEKVLYLDGDLVVRNSLSKLWNVDISNCALAGVRDAISDDIRLYNRLQYDISFGYINTGVLLLNLKYWRENCILKKCLEYMFKYPDRLVFKEQDVLNSALKHEKIFLPLRYNVHADFFSKESKIYFRRDFWKELKEAIKDPVILHYVTYPKPWLKECDLPYRAEWLKYIELTEWNSLKFDHMKGWKIYIFKKFIKRMLSVLKVREITDQYRSDIPKY